MAPSQGSAMRMLSLAVHPGSPLRSFVAIKAHRSSEGESEQGPALFFSGLPLGFDEAAVASVFGCFGEVERVVMHHNQLSGMVLFQDAAAVQAALHAASTQALVEWEPPRSEEPSGVKAWVHAHKAERPGNKALQKQLDEWVEDFEEEEARKERMRTAAMAEDGWTVVVRSKGRAKTTEDDGMTVRTGGVASAAANAKSSAVNVQREDTFYRFQAREKRRSELMELRRQFEQDRKRVAELRDSRRFKPY